MKSFWRGVQSLAVGLSLLGLMGCGGSDVASLHVNLWEKLDKARDFERAVISLSAIELLREDAPASVELGERRIVELLAPSDVGIGDPNPFPRPSPSPSISLLRAVEIPAGAYRAIRFAISGGAIEVLQVDGSIKSYVSEGYDVLPSNIQGAGALILPVEASSGLELELPEGATPGIESLDIVLDFDVAHSFSKDTTDANRWVMHPLVTVEAIPSFPMEE